MVDLYETSDCEMMSPLPTGIQLESICRISGIGLVGCPQTTSMVLAMIELGMRSGRETMPLSECEGWLLGIVRTYQSSGSNEGFRLGNTIREEVLMEVVIGDRNPGKRDVLDSVYVNVECFDVTL